MRTWKGTVHTVNYNYCWKLTEENCNELKRVVVILMIFLKVNEKLVLDGLPRKIGFVRGHITSSEKWEIISRA